MKIKFDIQEDDKTTLFNVKCGSMLEDLDGTVHLLLKRSEGINSNNYTVLSFTDDCCVVKEVPKDDLKMFVGIPCKKGSTITIVSE